MKNENKKGSKKSDKESSVGTVIAIGASVAALGAATYYFFGPEGSKHRKNFKAWTIKMKADIVEKIEDSKEVTEQIYQKIVDQVAGAYGKTGKATKEEIQEYAEKLKKQWKNISGQNKKKPTKKSASKSSAKKASKKSPAKKESSK